jgi:hypothetical protein
MPSSSTTRTASCVASGRFLGRPHLQRDDAAVPAFRLGLPVPDEQPLELGDPIEVAPLSVRVTPGLRRGWPVGRPRAPPPEIALAPGEPLDPPIFEPHSDPLGRHRDEP